MIADVPLGAFLSGGVDSSTVVAMMQAQSDRPVRTFSIGFHEAGFDEAPYARAVARHLGTEHTEFYVEPRHALDLVPRLPDLYDEPFADSSQIPTLLVSALTRRHVTVALTGDGGDEVFAGYNRYLWTMRLWRRMAIVPPAARAAFACALRLPSPRGWDRAFRLVPARWRIPQAGDKLHKLAGALAAASSDDLYRRLLSQWPDPAAIACSADEHLGVLWDPTVAAEIVDPVARMQFLDSVTYLPDDILTKVDRASMAASLEARTPLLDHRVVEFAWSLPLEQKIAGGETKRILRRVLSRYVPGPLVDRPKMGFGVPLDRWLRGPLRDWAEDLLDPAALAASGLLRPAPIRRAWAEHLSGARNWQYALWTVLMFEAWRRRWA